MFVRTMQCQGKWTIAWDYGEPSGVEYETCEGTESVWFVPNVTTRQEIDLYKSMTKTENER